MDTFCWIGRFTISSFPLIWDKHPQGDFLRLSLLWTENTGPSQFRPRSNVLPTWLMLPWSASSTAVFDKVKTKLLTCFQFRPLSVSSLSIQVLPKRSNDFKEFQSVRNPWRHGLISETVGCNPVKEKRLSAPAAAAAGFYPELLQPITIQINTIWKLNKYILKFGQIHFAIWTNTFGNLDKYILKLGQIHFIIWTNTFCNLDKYIFKFGQIHFAIWANTFCNLDKHILQGSKRVSLH